MAFELFIDGLGCHIYSMGRGETVLYISVYITTSGRDFLNFEVREWENLNSHSNSVTAKPITVATSDSSVIQRNDAVIKNLLCMTELFFDLGGCSNPCQPPPHK